jgi:hypothetical protein
MIPVATRNSNSSATDVPAAARCSRPYVSCQLLWLLGQPAQCPRSQSSSGPPTPRACLGSATTPWGRQGQQSRLGAAACFAGQPAVTRGCYKAVSWKAATGQPHAWAQYYDILGASGSAKPLSSRGLLCRQTALASQQSRQQQSGMHNPYMYAAAGKFGVTKNLQATMYSRLRHSQ